MLRLFQAWVGWDSEGEAMRQEAKQSAWCFQCSTRCIASIGGTLSKMSSGMRGRSSLCEEGYVCGEWDSGSLADISNNNGIAVKCMALPK